MRISRSFVLVTSVLALAGATPAPAADENPALNAPDQVAWELFVLVNTKAGGSNATFETWASDTDTFKPNPKFPAAPTPLSLHPPIVPAAGIEAMQAGGGLVPSVPPNPAVSEETRRNKPAFDFIVNENLYRISGLRAAFGKTLSFPVDAIEVKANWLPVEKVPAFTKNSVTLADVPKLFHVNKNIDGKSYALVSMHVISKLVPNWTWATFEHKFNPGRCDFLGCIDNFGAQTVTVAPRTPLGQIYPDCTKTAALSTLLGGASLDPAFSNYCLKGSQTDFTDNTGLDIRVGNSVTEEGFVQRSSCMTCHGRAGFDATGKATSNAGFDANGAPLGPIEPSWFWSFTNKPPIYQGMPGLKRTGTSVDFVWSVAFCAYDDTVTPVRPSGCTGK